MVILSISIPKLLPDTVMERMSWILTGNCLGRRSRRYIDLSVRPQGEILTAFPRAVVPFNKIHVPQDVYSRDEQRLAIMEMLDRTTLHRGLAPVVSCRRII